MSADVIARVHALDKKADELADKGHILRAAENFGRATEAAQPLGADSLVMLHMQLRQSTMLAAHATLAPDATADPCILAAHRTESIVLLSGAVEALERRRVADTLLNGQCAAAEVAWYANQLQLKTNIPAAETASLAALIVGYEQFMHAAKNAMDVLGHARHFAAECSYAQFQSFAQHAVHATELMQQRRRHNDMALSVEAQFANLLRDAAENGADGLLTPAWFNGWRARGSGWSAAACCRRAASRSASGTTRPCFAQIAQRFGKA